MSLKDDGLKARKRDAERHEQKQETLALLKILELGNRQIQAGNVHPALEEIEKIRRRKKGRIA